MGLKEAGARDSLRNISTGVSAIPDSAVSRWTFDDADTSGSTATDVWGSNDGTINGATTGATGANQTYTTNEAYSFDGVNDYVDTNIQSLTTPFSFALWVYPTDVTTEGGLISNFTGGSNDTYLDYGSNAAGEVRFTVDAAGDFIAPDGILSADQWQHIVATIGPSEIELYFDGSSQGTGSGVSDGTTVDSGRNWWIGWMNDNYHDGRIDDPRIYDKALSDSEVSNLYNNGEIA